MIRQFQQMIFKVRRHWTTVLSNQMVMEKIIHFIANIVGINSLSVL